MQILLSLISLSSEYDVVTLTFLLVSEIIQLQQKKQTCVT